MPDLAYFEQFTTERLEKRLLGMTDLAPLEAIIADTAEEYSRLFTLKSEGKLDFGGPVPREEFREIFKGIMCEVNKYLGISVAIRPPKNDLFGPLSLLLEDYGRAAFMGALSLTFLGKAAIDWVTYKPFALEFTMGAISAIAAYKILGQPPLADRSNRYYPQLKTIEIVNLEQCNFLPLATHEYAHHAIREAFLRPAGISCKKKSDHESFEAFEEGIARGTELHIREMLARESGNPAYMFKGREEILQDTLCAYAHICAAARQVPSLKAEEAAKLQGWTLDYLGRFPLNAHDIGSTTFSLLERERGPGIYQDALNGRLTLSRNFHP